MNAAATTHASIASGSPQLSVIIPTYNRRNAVQRAVDSVLQQAGAIRLEIIVVDDGSTDATDAAIRDRYGEDVRVQLIVTRNRGVSAARNTGFAAARGDLVHFLDSDDWVLPHTVGLVAQVFDEYADLQFLYVEGCTLPRTGKPARVRVARDECPGWQRGDVIGRPGFRHESVDLRRGDTVVGGHLASGDFFSAIVKGGLFFLSGLFIRRPAAAAAGPFFEPFHLWEDWDFHARLCLEGPGGYLDYIGFCRDVGRGDQLSDAVSGLRFAAMHCRIVRRLQASGRVRAPRQQRELAVAVADANYWMGRCLLATKHHRLARRLLLDSLLHGHKPLRSSALIARSWLP